MSDVAAVSQKLSGAPEELVLRSATARAAASGMTVDEVLAAWAGGASVGGGETPPAAATDEAPAPQAAAEADAPPATAEPAAVPAVVATAPAPAVATVLVEPPEEEAPIEPVAVGARIRSGVLVGTVSGAVLGLLSIAVASPLAVDRTDVVGDPAQPAILTTALATILTIAVASGVFGALVGVAARSIPSFLDRNFAVRGTATSAAVVGAIAGVVLGFVGGGLLVSLGEESLDGGVLLGVRSTLFALIIGGAALGGVTGAVVQALASPPELEPDVEETRSRISNAMMIPMVAGIVILGFVVPLGSLLVAFHEFAWIIAILVALGILTFAFLMSSRPNMAITRGELLLAAAGVGIVLIVIALVANELGGDGHGEDDHSGAEAAVVHVLT